MKASQSSSLLRNSFRWNAIFSLLSSVALLLLANPLSTLLMPIRIAILRVTGAFLLLFSVWLFRAAAQTHLTPNHGYVAIACDCLWVVGTFLMIALGVPACEVGKAAVSIVNILVFGFAVLQGIGVSRISSSLKV